jgi:AraC-like DNA-binding protein
MPKYTDATYCFDKETFRVRKMDFHEPVPPHKHPCYELFFVLGGKADFHIDCQTYHVDHPCLFLISPDRVHGWDNIDRLRGYLLKFELTVLSNCSFFRHVSAFNTDLIFIDEKEKENIHTTFGALEEEYASNQTFKDHTISSLLQILLIYVQRVLPAKNISHSNNALFAKLNEAIAQNGYKLDNTTHYAKKLGTSAKLLNHAVKEMANLSCGQYLRTQTIQEAKRLLKYEP